MRLRGRGSCEITAGIRVAAGGTSSSKQKERQKTDKPGEGWEDGTLAGEEYDKTAPVIACTLPAHALTDSIPERKREELAGSRRGDEGTAGRW